MLTLRRQVVHVIYRAYEVDPTQVILTIGLLFSVPTISGCLLYLNDTSPVKSGSISFMIYYATLFSSIIIYRISPFHPLSKYPGPFLAKITKLHGIRVMKTGKNHIYHKKLHEKYGPYVRVGKCDIFFRGVCAELEWLKN